MNDNILLNEKKVMIEFFSFLFCFLLENKEFAKWSSTFGDLICANRKDARRYLLRNWRAIRCHLLNPSKFDIFQSSNRSVGR